MSEQPLLFLSARGGVGGREPAFSAAHQEAGFE